MRQIFFTLFALSLFSLAHAQITLPPSGANQRSIVTQYMGSIAHVTINYSSPDVTAPNGADRRGQIWGQLVPYGLSDLGFGLRNPSPWRAGSNENTSFTFSHDVQIEGQPLAAGTYGFHVIVEKEGPWTLIFSNNSTAWGSFFYQESEDALRVKVSPKESDFHEWLTYEFLDRQPDACTVALMWENIQLPFTISVPNPEELYLTQIRQELQNADGFNWQGWNSAATYCIQNNINLEEALTWADNAISLPFVGQENFTTLTTKAQVLLALDRSSDAQAIIATAIEHPTANAGQIHQLGRALITRGDKEAALEVFQANHQRFAGAWPTEVGMARGFSAVAKYKEAAQHARIALEQAPDDLNRNNLRQMIETLEAGKDVN